MHNLTIFKERYVSELTVKLGENILKYSSPTPWIESAFDSARDLNTSLKTNGAWALKLPDQTSKYDLENAIKVYETLPRLTKLQARDPRLWTRLCHVECWEYMQHRWGVADISETATKENKIISRYFISQNQSRALMRNGLARLWWLCEATHDDTKDNPYELTAILLSTLDITQSIMERAFGRSKQVTLTLLDFIKDNRKSLIDEGNKSRHRVRALARFINAQGGATMIDSIPVMSLKSLLSKELESILSDTAQ